LTWAIASALAASCALIGEARQHGAVTRALLAQALLLGLILAALGFLALRS
jgi:hypothetical protein